MSQGEFRTAESWQALTDLLNAQLDGVDIAPISERDFNEQGEIIMVPPSVRIFFGGERFLSTSDSQRLSYESVGQFILLCADENLRGIADQALASVALADQVKSVLAGARLKLASGDVSEPVTLIATEPQPVDGVGTAYCVAIEVPGLAQYPGVNA